MQKVHTNADGATRPVRHANDRFDTRTIRLMKGRNGILVNKTRTKKTRAGELVKKTRAGELVHRYDSASSRGAAKDMPAQYRFKQYEETSFRRIVKTRLFALRRNSPRSRSTTQSHTLGVRI